MSGGLVGGLEGYLPDTLVTYLGETAKEGLEVLEEVYNDTRQETVDKSSKHIDEVTEILSNFITKLEDVYESAEAVASQEIVLRDEQILNIKEAWDLQGTKEELENLEDIVQKEREENVNIEGLEGQLQKLITEARGLLSTVNSESDLAWSKVKQLELEFYQVAKLMADTSGQVKESLKQAWSTLSQELEDVSPAIKDIFDSVGQENSEKNETEASENEFEHLEVIQTIHEEIVGTATETKDSVDNVNQEELEGSGPEYFSDDEDDLREDAF